MDLYRAALVIIRIDSLFKGLLFKTIRLVSDKTQNVQFFALVSNFTVFLLCGLKKV